MDELCQDIQPDLGPPKVVPVMPLRMVHTVLSCAVIDRDLGDPQTHIFPESLPQDGFRTMQYAHIRPTGKRTA